MKKCKQCGKEYDPNEVKRTLGEESSPYLLGYCSARCYTKHITGI
jgi:hypothetical protein